MSVGNMILLLESEFEVLPCQVEQDIIVMATLTSPESETTERSSRAPVHLCCVLDKSGSMAGGKLDLMKVAMQFVIQQFKAQDRLSVVLFDTDVVVVLRSQKMDANGKTMAMRKVEEICSGSSTNLSGGLQEGLTLLKDNQNSNDVCSLLLFTDGQANHGLQQTSEIVAMMSEMLVTMPPCSVFTFGFGSDHNATMLQEISGAGQGTYYFISRQDEIPSAFGDCVGGLLSVAAQNVKITFQAVGKYTLKKILSSYPSEKTENGEELRIGDMYSEEQKHLLFLVAIPKVDEEKDDLMMTLSLSYFDVGSCKAVQHQSNCSIKRVASNESTPGSSAFLIDQQRNRLAAAEALKKASDYGEQGDMQKAKEILLSALNAITSSRSSADPFCVDLVQDIQNLMQTMRDRESYMIEGGHHTAKNMMSTHNSERCTSSAYTTGREQCAQQRYNTKAKFSGMSSSPYSFTPTSGSSSSASASASVPSTSLTSSSASASASVPSTSLTSSSSSSLQQQQPAAESKCCLM